MTEITPRDRDAMIRAIVGEAGGQGDIGQAAVAHVIMNRAAKYGDNPVNIVYAPNQFETTASRNTPFYMVKETDPAYRRAGEVVDLVASGKVKDFTNGSTHFYAPKLQAQLGRKAPDWAKGESIQIGDHHFYAPEGRVSYATAKQSESAPNTPQRNRASGMSNDELFDAIKGGDSSSAFPGPAAPPSPKVRGSGMSNDDLFDALRNGIAPQPLTSPSRDDQRKRASGPPAVSPEGLRDPFTGELVVAGRGFSQDSKTGEILQNGQPYQSGSWNAGVSVANGALQGLGTRLMAGVQAAKPGAPEGTYTKALDAYEAQRAAYNKAHPLKGTGSEIAGSLSTAIPAAVATSGALGALGSVASKASPALRAAAPAVEYLAGNGGTNFLTRAASTSANGALQGGFNALLTQNLSDSPLIEQIGSGSLAGGALGVAAPVAANALTRALGATKAVVEPFYESGRNAIADRAIAAYAAKANPVAHYNPVELVPGSVPTLAQATANPGIAALERGARNANGPAFGERDAYNAARRNEFWEALKGDELSKENLLADRAFATAPLREAAFKNASRANPQGVVNKIDEILAGPEGKRDAVVRALNNIKGKIVRHEAEMPDGSTLQVLETDPEQLYGVRGAVRDMLSGLSKGEDADARLARQELLQVRDELDKSIEKAAPGFRNYLREFAERSKPVDTQELLQRLNLTDLKGNVTGGRIDQAIKRIENARAAPGASKAKSISQDDLDKLYALRDDLRRQEYSKLGMSIGSPTVQNLATNNLAAQLGVPLSMLDAATSHNPLLALPGMLVRRAYNAQNENIVNALTNKLLDPMSVVQPAAFAGARRYNPVPVAVPLAQGATLALPAFEGRSSAQYGR